MFKKLLHSAFALFLLAGTAQAQVNYTFSAVSGTFTAVTGSTTAVLAPNCGYAPTVQGDEGYMNAIPVGFNFNYNGLPYSAINVATNGLASLGSGFIAGATACSYDNTSGLTSNPTVTTGRPILAPFWDDLDVASIDYVTTGSTPNRVFTVQWTNAKWDYSATAGVLSFQIKIYETTNVIEFVYRQDAGTPANASGGASIGITAVGTGAPNFMSLNNATATPTASSTTETTSIGTRPATGQVYRWTPVACPSPTLTPTSASLCAGSGQLFSLSGSSTAPQSFTNASTITINASGTATPYPSPLVVSGLPTSGVSVKSVRLNGISHTYPDDVDIVLVGPGGTQYVILVSDANLTADWVNQTYTFDDAAATTMSDAPTVPDPNGTYKPTNWLTPDDFPAPGPGTGIIQANPTLSTFTGNMNGTWNLYVVDDLAGDAGSISGGFTITFSVPAPVTGTFSPAAGLFTSQGGPAYTGTAVASVWAAPTATTTYTVTVVNGPCTTNTNFTVTVANPPTFSTQPTAKTVCELGTTSFTAATAAASTLQWQDSIPGVHNWLDIAGATTGTYTLTGVPLSYNNRYYRVLASAAPCTGIASNGVKLTVNALPVINITAAPYTRLYPGLVTTLTASSLPALTTGFKWFKNGVQVPGATTNKIDVNVDNQGVYTASVTDANGCTSLTSREVSILDSTRGNLFIIPNPNKGVFDVRYYSVANNTVPRSVIIYDAKGSRVYVQEFTVGAPYAAMRVDMTRFRSGTYWLEVADRNGKRLKFGKVIIL